MFSLKRKSADERRLVKERRRGVQRRKCETKVRLRTGFRNTFMRSYGIARNSRDEPMSKKEWLETLVFGTAAEASRYIYQDRNGRTVPWRMALEKTSELAWDLNESRIVRGPHINDSVECAERMIQSTVDYLLARCKVYQIDRRISGERRF